MSRTESGAELVRRLAGLTREHGLYVAQELCQEASGKSGHRDIQRCCGDRGPCHCGATTHNDEVEGLTAGLSDYVEAAEERRNTMNRMLLGFADAVAQYGLKREAETIRSYVLENLGMGGEG